MRKQDKDITLIALVVTIIVLLVLAGLTISLALNQNGIIERSKLAASKYSAAADKEQADLEEFNSKVNNITTESEISKLTIGTALDAADYGKKVSYAGTNDQWRLYYKDANYAYLIKDTPMSMDIDWVNNEWSKYTSGANMSEAGKKLSPLASNIGLSTNTYPKTTFTCLLTDNKIWDKEYKKGDALFAIASPTAELFIKSYNAATNSNDVQALPDDLKDGYYFIRGIITSEKGGIYNNGTDEYFFASPNGYGTYVSTTGINTMGNNGGTGTWVFSIYDEFSNKKIRPVVCIPAASLQLAE